MTWWFELPVIVFMLAAARHMIVTERRLHALERIQGGVEYDQRDSTSSTAPSGSTCTMEQAE